jgi:hypothetical protein
VNPIEEAILRTVLYADIFSFPMTPREIHHFLIHDTTVTLARVEHTLATSTLLGAMLRRVEDYIVCAGRENIIGTRRERERASEKLWPLALVYGQRLARLPFVRMVALTGALAMRNAAANDDDLDYILVTAENRVWLARAFAIVLVRLARLRGVILCPNYVLAESALAQERQDLFMAHEVTQMIPLYGYALYRRFRAANRWVDDQLPNAEQCLFHVEEKHPGRFWGSVKGMMEWVLRGRVGDTLEVWEHRRKLRRFAQEMQLMHSAARLDAQHVKGHFNDHGHPVLRHYRERLRAYGLQPERETALRATGD